ncbi:MAG: macrolide ABC transporter ATP-binding protein, partial [Nitrospinaceae bacterium]|nr:macrolide ABC transporter ATP-binding protein [Nitrospinaceae bacterium]NIR55048.1 macrolide ABC transporter ATP-binding protein [Nitrospinaceae bacterium]NIS85452.1 macrolide ABC transporter ATP-binding protein [Nitrospinaceae bacterium]NIT82286.1 macrolide ABC transporter ATP-binding protein [Nitrospinaceae bacterium]NIU44517.1 macrolide ABC transporter ATP-binding protein [Nitrospinaceae bacterium]
MIEVEGLSKIYLLGQVEVTALQEVSFQFERGEFAAIMGP